ncbi:hypothetical protein F511_26802 [Dorcoceras hygrometricum]|uniref:Dystroglycan-like n=1 Tax=Dorcoceras hygrometricum TaxID=472368 RepID=A0A2Z7C2S4_9LAMI|nr:hypothetical protein F511_26802 [Dorcoceras hygrometricum]
MASSFYSNAQHVDFDSVLGMDDHGMVSMFEALMASGLRGFLDALGVIISTVGGQLVEISEKLFAKAFELPVDGLGDLSEMPKDAIFDARSIVSLSGEPISLSGRKNQMKMPFRLLCDIVAKAISVKAGSFNVITVEKFSLITTVVCGIKMNWAKFLFSILKKMVVCGVHASQRVCRSDQFIAGNFSFFGVGDGAEEVAGAAKKKAVSKKRPAADVGAAVPKKKRSFKKKSVSSMELVEVAEEAIPIQQVAEPLDVEEPRCSSADAVDLIIQQVLDETRAADAPADIAQPAVSEEKHWFDLPYDDLVKQWEAERPVVTASDTDEDLATVDVAPAVGVQQVEEFVAPISAEVTLSADEQMSLDDILLTIPVDIPLPSTCMESLPSIPTGDKGKEVLVEKDPVKGNPAEEHYSLICADIDLLLSLRAQAWRTNFAPVQGSSAIDIQVIELLSDLYLYFLEELAKEARNLGITWTKPGCSKIFEGSPRDRGAVIARSNSNTRSKCWIRKMILVDGLWTVELCADRWVKIPKRIISTVVPRQRQFDDTLHSMSVFFRLMKKRWADVCLENDVVEVHSVASADEAISRYFVEEISSWLSLFVEDCDTTAFGLVGTTAFCLIQQKRSFDKPAEALLGVNQQMYFKDSKTASLD